MNATLRDRDDVIVVDPNLHDYSAVFATWRAAGVRVGCFTEANDALRRARPQPAATWLVSTRVVDTTSIELLAVVRRRSPRAAVLLVGDAYSAADEFAARLAGATAYICKPPSCQWLAGLPRCRSPAIRAGPIQQAREACS